MKLAIFFEHKQVKKEEENEGRKTAMISCPGVNQLNETLGIPT